MLQYIATLYVYKYKNISQRIGMAITYFQKRYYRLKNINHAVLQYGIYTILFL